MAAKKIFQSFPAAATSVGIVPLDAAVATLERAQQLAAQLQLPLVKDAGEVDVVLAVREDRLELQAGGETASSNSPGAVYCDFVTGAFGHRMRSGQVGGEMLIKAVRGRKAGRGASGALRVVDATAGLGRDAMLLGLAGFEVTALERSPIIAAVLSDGLQRAREAGGRAAEAAERVELINADAAAWLAALPEVDRPDVITLDPMFPERSKSALVKKEMRLCRMVSGGDADAAALLDVARQVARGRVVVKRPAHAEPLGHQSPTVSQKGRSVRYDIYAKS
ncbi:MAG: class I SAM-dependent methyltransferase [Phycisphaeraceae bacterium]